MGNWNLSVIGFLGLREYLVLFTTLSSCDSPTAILVGNSAAASKNNNKKL